MKKISFTLAEVLIVVTIVGIISVMVMTNMNSKAYKEQNFVIQGRKVISTFNQAMAEIAGLEREQCPEGAFISGTEGNEQFAIYNESGTIADSEAIVNLFSNYIRFDQTGIPFCAYSGYCLDDSIIGAKMSGGIYVGIKVGDGSSDVFDCPDYVLPGDEIITPPQNKGQPSSLSTRKCWGYLYTDVNGTEGPNMLGKDVYVFNLDADGVQD